MKILMIVFQFPPLNSSACSRMYSFAKYWARQGNIITVITPKKYSFHGSLNYNPKYNEKFELVEVDFAKWFTKKYESNDIQKKSEKKSGGYLRRVLRYFRRNFIGNTMDIHKLWEKEVFTLAESLISENEDYDVVFSSYSPFVTHTIASKLKKKYPELFWVADYRDLWSGNHLLKANNLLGYLQKQKEKKVLKNADMIITVSDGFKKYLEQLHNREVEVVYNGYDHEEIESVNYNEKFFPEDKKIRFVYTGTIYVGTRDPSPFFQILKRLDLEGFIFPNTFEVCFFGDSANVMQIARKEDVEKYIKIGGNISKEDSYRVQHEAYGIIFLEEESKEYSLSSEGTIPAKIYEHLVSGTEIFGIGMSKNSFVGKVIMESGMGNVYFNDLEKLYYRVKDIVLDKKKQIMIPNSEFISQFRRENSAKKVLLLIENKRKEKIETLIKKRYY